MDFAERSPFNKHLHLQGKEKQYESLLVPNASLWGMISPPVIKILKQIPSKESTANNSAQMCSVNSFEIATR
jgi:hypothetical protein